jgi:murein L,D-transpeptidase YafK
MFQSSDIRSQAGASTDAKEVRDENKTPLKLPLVEPRIVVTKSKRQLALYSAGKVVRLYTVGLGFNPKEDKARQGDGCTPEGSFYVCVKNPQSSFYLSLGLSYPNKEHAERGLRDRIINRAQYDEIMSALQRRARPPWNTRLGGEIFIHGNGSQSDWTWGCVALDNDDMKELYDAIPKGADVVIEP